MHTNWATSPWGFTSYYQISNMDTINNIVYHRLITTEENGNEFYLDSWLRQDSLKIYGIMPQVGINNDTLCIDYDITIGDTMKGVWVTSYSNILVVDSISTYSNLGITRKVFYINRFQADEFQLVILEGVGFFDGGIYHDMVEPIPGGAMNIVCHSINGQTFWVTDSTFGCDSAYSLLENEIRFNMYPNPSIGLIKIEGADLFNSKFQVLDLQGRIIPFNLSIINNEMAEIEVLSKGLFLLQLNNKRGSMSKLIKIE